MCSFQSEYQYIFCRSVKECTAISLPVIVTLTCHSFVHPGLAQNFQLNLGKGIVVAVHGHISHKNMNGCLCWISPNSHLVKHSAFNSSQLQDTAARKQGNLDVTVLVMFPNILQKYPAFALLNDTPNSTMPFKPYHPGRLGLV